MILDPRIRAEFYEKYKSFYKPGEGCTNYSSDVKILEDKPQAAEKENEKHKNGITKKE